MPTTIAISGKGGSGKTTLAAMIIRLLLHRRNKTVLAVDADPNSCLGLTMGVQPLGTIAEIREQARSKSPTNSGMTRVQSFEYGIQQAITEADGFDLLTMGRPEGPDCYCAANNLLRQFLDKLSSSYDFVVIDNEAGMEHLSRRTTNNVDFLCIVAEPTPLGAVTAKRIFDLAEELPISVKKIGVIWNDTRGTSDERRKTGDGLETFGCIPFDESVFNASMQGKTVFDLEENSPAFSAVQKILEHILVPSLP
ncbi:MAG: AAA family ATPase [Sedimentisphaerales bacterium]